MKSNSKCNTEMITGVAQQCEPESAESCSYLTDAVQTHRQRPVKPRQQTSLSRNDHSPVVSISNQYQLSAFNQCWHNVIHSCCVLYKFFTFETNFADCTFADAGKASWNRRRHGTDYQQQSGHLTLCRISRTNWKRTSSNGPFPFLSAFISSAGTLELDSVLRCLRN